jgi:hypothetical protein
MSFVSLVSCSIDAPISEFVCLRSISIPPRYLTTTPWYGISAATSFQGKEKTEMVARLLVAVTLVMVSTAAAAQPIQLITEQEAKLPPATQAPSRAITRGPAVKLLRPDGVASGAFPLKVVFQPHGGAKIDPASVQVTYLKNPFVDLTGRVKSGIRPDGIDLAAVTAPGGDHPIRITVRDDEGRQGALVINLSVK